MTFGLISDPAKYKFHARLEEPVPHFDAGASRNVRSLK
jgi:hypothetical protein